MLAYLALMLWKHHRAIYQLVLSIAWYSTAILALSACAFEIGRLSSLPEETAEIQELIKPGVSTHDEVRQILGEPTISSDQYRIALYRNTDTEWGVPVFPPLPLRHKQEFVSYVLIAYNDSWVVDDFDTGVWIEWSSFPGTTRPEFVHLGAGGFGLYTANPYSSSAPSEALLAPAEWNKEIFAETISSEQCVLYLSPDLLIDRIYLDEEMLTEIGGVDLGEAYFRLSLALGEHRLRFDLRDLGYKYSTPGLEHEFSCVRKQGLYIDVTADFEAIESALKRARCRIDVTQSESMPSHFEEKRQILYQNDKWWNR